MTDDVITLDVLTSGEVWAASKRIVSKSVNPELHAARSLRGLGASLDTVVHFRRMGQIVRQSSLYFLLREDATKRAERTA